MKWEAKMVVTIGRGKDKQRIDNAVGFNINNGIATVERDDLTAVITTDSITVELTATEVRKLKEAQNGKEEVNDNNG